MTSRFGFCCKYVHPNPKTLFESVDGFNTGATTVAWLNRQNREVAEQRLWDLMVRNLAATQTLVDHVGTMDEQKRMVRLSSDILPMYTEPSWRYFWQRVDVRDYCANHFARIGHSSRNNRVRLSFHPGQFCVLASDNDDIVVRSMDEFEYHVDMARWMGFGSSWHDHGFKINVHLSGRGGAEKFRNTLSKLSTEARNLITIENDEMANGLDIVLDVADCVAIVLDIHHHWVKTGEYIDPQDPRVQRVVESWRGVRPAMHYSVSREDCLVDHDPTIRPDHAALVAAGHNRQKLRAHSDFMWNHAVNHWAGSFSNQFDIQVEAKGKNLARDSFVRDLGLSV